MKKLFEKPWMQFITSNIVIIISFVFGMQMLRLLFLSLVGYVRDSLGFSALELAPWAVAIFALSLLAALVNKFFGIRRSLSYLITGLAFIRLTEQIVRTPQLDLILSVAGTTFFLWLIAFLISRSIQEDSSIDLLTSIAIALSIDTALFIAFDTLDLSWQAGFLPMGIVLILVGIIFLKGSEGAVDQANKDVSWSQGASLIAFGPWIVLQLLLFQNAGYFGSQLGSEAYSAGILILASNAIALYLLPKSLNFLNSRLASLIAHLLLALILFALPSSTGMVAGILLVVGNFLSFLSLYRVISQLQTREKTGMLALSTMLGLGMILLILAAFIYYATYDINFGIRSNVVAPGLAILMLLTSLFSSSDTKKEFLPGIKLAWLPVLLLILLPTAKWVLRSTPPEYSGISETLLVMNYNLHNAVNTSGILDPESLAQVIEESGAEVVGLQEVSRGWLTWGSLDMLTWLSQRLDMHYAWGPSADSQWGNAILSRYPIESFQINSLPPEDVLLLRGFTVANINLDGQSITLIDTHFSHRDDQGPERLQQSSAILDAWNQASHTVIMGDLNAEPNSDEIMLLVENGLVDISAEIGNQPTYTYHADDPDHQIDYIFVSPDMGYSAFEIIRTSASDHLPLVVSIDISQ